MLDDALWTGRPVKVDSNQIETLRTINVILYSWHTQNIKINKVIGENENCVFYFTKKTIWTFWPTQYYVLSLIISDRLEQLERGGGELRPEGKIRFSRAK